MSLYDPTQDHGDNFYRVLLIDDSMADVELYTHFLKKDTHYCYEVIHGETAEEGLKLFEEQAVDMVFVDYSLPDMNGLELWDSLQKTRPSYLRCMMMTGQGNEAIATQSIRQGYLDYLIKQDLTINRFLQAVHKLIADVEDHVLPQRITTIDVLMIWETQEFLSYKNIQKQIPDQREDVVINCQWVVLDEARELLQEKGVDVIVWEYHFHQDPHYQKLKKFKQINQVIRIPLILVAHDGSEKSVVEAFRQGITEYLPQRDLTPEVLLRSIIERFDQHRFSQQFKNLNFQRQFVGDFITQIHKFTTWPELLDYGVKELVNYLQCDRALIYGIESTYHGHVITEARRPGAKVASLQGMYIGDSFLSNQENHDGYIYDCHQQVVDNVEQDPMDDCHRALLRDYQVKSVVSVPIVLDRYPAFLWGLVILHFCHRYHHWTPSELNFINEITQQLAIALDQCLLMDALRQERDRANEVTRLKSAFLANMSHEIRTPLNGILGISELMGLENLTQEQQEYVGMIHGSGRNLLRLIDDILDLSKLEAKQMSLKKQVFDLEKLLKDSIHLLKPEADKNNLALTLDIDEGVPQVFRGDSQRIGQILLNLLGNAIKFTEEGSVVLRVSVQVASKERPHSLHFSVEDTGIGIETEAQSKLFKSFSRVEQADREAIAGTGLGLSICKQLVELMDGEIGLESVAGQGSTFWFSLPHPEGAPPKLKPTIIKNQPKLPVPLKSGPAKILVVEDNPQNQRLLIHQLKFLGYGCDVVGNGADALDILQGQDYDLVLMDCRMPILNGYDTTRRLRTMPKTKDLVVIALTAFAMKGDEEKCLAAGMNAYLTKPCNLPDLKATLAKWLPSHTPQP